jgi:hypothetical protein
LRLVLRDRPQSIPKPILIVFAAKLAGGLAEGRDLRLGGLNLFRFFQFPSVPVDRSYEPLRLYREPSDKGNAPVDDSTEALPPVGAWWNWKTQRTLNPPPDSMWVQIPPPLHQLAPLAGPFSFKPK